MTNVLIFLVKLARDSGYTDKQLADELQHAADHIRRGGFWPSDIDSNSLRYQTSTPTPPQGQHKERP